MKLTEGAQNALDAVVNRFMSGDLSPIVSIAQIKRDPADKTPSAAWSLRNQIIAYAQTESLDCRGFRQWQEINRYVRKGEHAAYILAPCTKMEENEKGEEVPTVVGFRAVPVFALHQTDGDPAPTFDYSPEALPPLADVARALGVSNVEYLPITNARGMFSAQTGKITLGTHDTKTWFHELGHAVHAKIKPLRGGQDAHQETVAEFTATVLMWLYGYGDRSGNAWEYIGSYNKDPLRAIYSALGEVEQILQIIESVTRQGIA